MDAPQDAPAALVNYMGMWNETDPGAVRAHVEKTFVADAHFCDPMHDLTGHDAIEAMVIKLREGFPTARYSLASAVDSHHDRHRYHWHADLGEQGELPGFDVTLLAEDGRIQRVDGFFGDVDRA